MMSGDWIKMRCNLWDDPRVMKICDLTEQSEATVVGALYWLWTTGDQHTEDGILHGLSLRAIDRKTGVAGFGNALVTVGWLVDHPEGVRITRFDEHNGKSAKTRIQTAKRVANFKSNASVVTETENTNEEVTQDALPDQQSTVSDALPREEIEKSKPTSLRDVPLSDKTQKSITFSKWLAEIKAIGQKPVSEHRPLWDFVAKVGLSEDWIQIAWLQFVERYTDDEKGKRKRYSDWRRVFVRAVKENWFGLWYFAEADHSWRLTSKGVAADLDSREAA